MTESVVAGMDIPHITSCRVVSDFISSSYSFRPMNSKRAYGVYYVELSWLHGKREQGYGSCPLRFNFAAQL